MLEVYWLEQTDSDLPPDNEWLSADEALCLTSLRFLKRRADWRLGRWTAKRAVAAYLNLPSSAVSFSTIEIRSAPLGAPQVFFDSKPASVTISLSHRAGNALCALAGGDVELGCDLELIEEHSQAFISDYFTDDEQYLLEGISGKGRACLATLIWSAKESALKALRVGLRLDTREVIVRWVGRELGNTNEDAEEGSWRGLLVSSKDGQLFHGWWRQTGSLLCTVVGTPPPACPRPLMHCQPTLAVPASP